MLLGRTLVCLKSLDLRAIHKLHDLIRLPFLEAESQTLMRIVLIVGLIFMVLDLDEVTIDGSGVE